MVFSHGWPLSAETINTDLLAWLNT